jgi:CO dehydrogenase maturation factor
VILEQDGFDILTMGRPEGPGCYCYVNNVLRNIVSKLIKDYDYVVIDNEAGLEHLSRRTTREADVLIIVSDGTVAGMRTANRIYGLVKELKIKTKKNFLIVNRGKAKPKDSTEGLEYLGGIPEDKDIQYLSLNGHSLLDLEKEAVSIKELRKIGEKIL